MNYIHAVAKIKNRLDFHKTNGFTLLELLVVMALFFAMTTTVIRMMYRRDPARDHKNFVAAIDRLTTNAWQRSIQTKTIHRLFFDLNARRMTIQEHQPAKDESPKAICTKGKFAAITSSYIDSSYSWPETIIIKNIYINDEDMLTYSQEVWFCIMPDGMGQRTVLNVIDRKDQRIAREGYRFSLVLNPFTMQFREQDGFKKI